MATTAFIWQQFQVLLSTHNPTVQLGSAVYSLSHAKACLKPAKHYMVESDFSGHLDCVGVIPADLHAQPTQLHYLHMN